MEQRLLNAATGSQLIPSSAFVRRIIREKRSWNMFGVKRNRKLAVLLSLALVVELFAISPNTASANVSKEPAETVSTGFIEDSQEAPLALRLEDSFWGTTRYDAPSDVLDEPLVLTLEDSFQEAAMNDELFLQSANSLLGSAPTSKLTISNSSRNYTYQAQSDNFTVSGVKGSLSYEYTWLPSGQNGWARCIYNGSYVKVTIDKNPKTSSRKVIIKVIDSQTKESAIITITQDPGPKPTNAPTNTPTNTPTPTKKTSKTPTPYLSLASTTPRDYGYQATSDTITVKGRQGSLTFEYSWSPSTQTDWARLIFDGSSIKVTIDENKTTEARSVTVKIIDSKTKKSASIKLNQKAGPSRPDTPTPSNSPGPTSGPKPSNSPTPFLTVNSPSRTYNYTGATDTITVNGCQGSLQYDFSWSPAAVTGWAHLVYDGKSLKLTVDTNNSSASRSVTVKLTDTKTKKTATLTINQTANTNAPTHFLSVNSPTRSFSYQGGTDSLTINGRQGTLHFEYTWTPSTQKDWVVVSFDGTNYKLSVSANQTTVSRSASIKITDDKTNKTAVVTVNQAGAPPTPTPFLSISQASRTYTYQGASDTVSVKGVQGSLKYEFKWNSGAKDWVSLLYDGSRIKLTVSPNNSVSSRSVTVKIIDSKTNKTATLSISQSGAPPTPTPFLTINNSATRTYDYHATTDTVSLSGVQGTLEYAFVWSHGHVRDWLHVIYDGQTVKLTVDANTNHFDRSVTVTITDTKTLKTAVLEIKQTAEPLPEPSPTPYIKINNSATRSYDYHSASDTVTISGAHGGLKFEFKWYPGTETDWAHIIYDGQTIKYRVDTNNSTSPRSVAIKIRDSVTFAFDTLIIEQEGFPLDISGTPVPVLTVNSPARTYDYTKRTDTFSLTGFSGALRFEYSWTPASPTDWARFIFDGKSITLSLDENPSTDDRTAFVKVIDTTTQKYVNLIIKQTGRPKPVKIEFVVKDKHGEAINAYTVDFVMPGKPFGNIFPQVSSPNEYHIATWKDQDGNYYNKDSIAPSTDTITLTPIWCKKDCYVVIFDGNGARSGSMTMQTYTYKKTYSLPEVGFDRGVGFDRWGTSRDGLTGNVYKDKSKFSFDDTSCGSVTLYALWFEHKHAAYFNPITETAMEYDRLTHIYKIKGVADFPELELKGLKFLGWAKNSHGLFDKPDYIPGAETFADGHDWNLYPVYELSNPEQSPVYFYDPLHDILLTELVSKDQQYVTAPTPAVVGGQYQFQYWSTQRTTDEPALDYRWKAGEKMELADSSFEYSCPILIAYWKFSQEELHLLYNYDNKVDVITVTQEDYTLPSPERRGYQFLGWSEDGQSVDYPGGATYHVPKYGETLYAIWEPICFTVEYYDGISGVLLDVVETTVLDKIKRSIGSSHTVSGMRFAGWTEIDPGSCPHSSLPWVYESDNPTTIYYKPDESAENLPLERETIKLFSCFVLWDRPNYNETVIYYIPDGTLSFPQTSHHQKGSEIHVAQLDMKRTGYIFDGWEMLNDSSGKKHRYYSNDIISSKSIGESSVIFMLAHWKPSTTVRLNYGDKSNGGQDLTQYGYGDKIKTEDLAKLLPKNPGSYLKNWIVSDGKSENTVGVSDYIDVPNSNITITAVWGAIEYNIIYHSTVSSQLSTTVPVKGPLDKTYFEKQDFSWIDQEGLTFVGWSTTNPGIYYWNPAKYHIYTWNQLSPLEITSDLNLYACYVEDNPPKSGLVRIFYDDNGGTGGPGLQYVNLAEERVTGNRIISNIVPTRDGYEFKGWYATLEFDREGRTPATETFIRKCTEDTIYLIARWHAKNNNTALRTELQSRYGKTVMPDYMFLSEYESTEWEPINGLSYFVISTRNARTSEHETNYESTILIVEWDYGKWVLRGGSASHNLKKIFEYEMTTNFPDGVGFMSKVALNGTLTVMKKIPYAKWVAYAVEIEAVLADLIDTFAKDNSLIETVTKRASSKLATKLLKEQVKTLPLSEAERTALYLKIFTSVYDWVYDGLTKNRKEMVTDLKLLKSLTMATTKYAYEMDLKKVQEAFVVLNGKVNLDILKHAEDDPVLSNLALKNNATVTVLPDWGFDLLEFFWDTAVDGIEYELSKKSLDPFGNYNDALVAFQKEITAHGFSDKIKNTFPRIINSIYNAYYGIE